MIFRPVLNIQTVLQVVKRKKDCCHVGPVKQQTLNWIQQDSKFNLAVSHQDFQTFQEQKLHTHTEKHTPTHICSTVSGDIWLHAHNKLSLLASTAVLFNNTKKMSQEFAIVHPMESPFIHCFRIKLNLEVSVWGRKARQPVEKPQRKARTNDKFNHLWFQFMEWNLGHTDGRGELLLTTTLSQLPW